MNAFPLRFYVRNHRPILSWEKLPSQVRSIFEEEDASVVNAEFFLADAQQGKNQFVVSLMSAGQLSRHEADAIALHQSELAILIKYAGRGNQLPETIAIKHASVETAGYSLRGEAMESQSKAGSWKQRKIRG